MTCDLCEAAGNEYSMICPGCVVRWIRNEPELIRRRSAMDWVRRNQPAIAETVERGVVDVLA